MIRVRTKLITIALQQFAVDQFLRSGFFLKLGQNGEQRALVLESYKKVWSWRFFFPEFFGNIDATPIKFAELIQYLS